MKERIRCDEVSKLLLDYLEGELESSMSAKMKKHVDECPHCREEMAVLTELLKSVGAGTEEEPTPGYFDYLYSRIKARMEEEGTPVGSPAIPSNAQRLRSLLGGWRMAYAVAAFLIVAAAVATIQLITPASDMRQEGVIELVHSSPAEEWIDPVGILDDLEPGDLDDVNEMLSDEIAGSVSIPIEEEGEEDGILSGTLHEELAELDAWQMEALAAELERAYNVNG